MTARIGRKMIDREHITETWRQHLPLLAAWMLRAVAITLVACAVLVAALS
jgi:uncharacterized membrane-anchored protein